MRASARVCVRACVRVCVRAQLHYLAANLTSLSSAISLVVKLSVNQSHKAVFLPGRQIIWIPFNEYYLCSSSGNDPTFHKKQRHISFQPVTAVTWSNCRAVSL